MKTLAELLQPRSGLSPDALAVRFAGRDVSYAKLACRTERAAARLWHEWGVRSGDRVAYLGLNHVDQLTLLLALARLGAMLVPLNFRLAPPEWSAVLNDCTPTLLLHDSAWAEPAQALAQQHAIAAHHLDSLIARHADGEPPERAEPEAPVLLVYTSGTTGLPKGAVHTQANLLANMAAASQVQGMTPADRVLTILPLFHVGGLCIQTLPALYAGAQVLLHERFDPGAVLQCVASERPTLTLQVPATMRALLAHPQWDSTDWSGLRAVWAGSSTLPDALVQAFLARGVALCNVYGATETGPFSIALGPDHARSHVGSCGWPAPGVQVQLGQVKDGVGELLLRAPNVVRHYWPDRPALDASGWFHSGDLARQAEDGSYTVVGRAKDMIISGGENIYPAEVEQCLAEHPALAECAVIGMVDERWGEVVVAALVLQPGATVSDDELLSFLAARIARYKLPRRFVRLESLPRTALGKVQKVKLQELMGTAP